MTTLNASKVKWEKQLGNAKAIGYGNDGSLWKIGTNPHNPGNPNFSINKWNGSSWQQLSGWCVRMTVGGDGKAWTINSINDLSFHQDQKPVSAGHALYVEADSDGDIWIVSVDHKILRFDTSHNNWVAFENPFPGKAIAVAVVKVGSDEFPFVIDDQGNSHRFTGIDWQEMGRTLVDITVSADKVVWGTDKEDRIWRFEMAAGVWEQVEGGAKTIAAGKDGVAYCVNASGVIWRSTMTDSGSLRSGTVDFAFANVPDPVEVLKIPFDGARPDEIASFLPHDIDTTDATEIVEGVLSGVGGVATVAGIIGAAAGTGPAGWVVVGVVGLVTGLAAGIMAIVGKVQAENWTTIFVNNFIPDSIVSVEGIAGDLTGDLVNDQEGKLNSKDVTLAKAKTNEGQLSGFALHFLPPGNRNFASGTLQLKVTKHPGTSNEKIERMTLSFKNTVGTGVRSEYSLDWNNESKLEISSRRPSNSALKDSFITQDVSAVMQLIHPSRRLIDGIDQRKDVLVLSFVESPKSARENVSVTLKNSSGFLPVFQIGGSVNDTVNARRAPWSTTKQYSIPVGGEVVVTAQQANGRSVSGRLSVANGQTVVAKGVARRGRIEIS